MEERYISIKLGSKRDSPCVDIAFHVEDKEADTEHVRTFAYNRLKDMSKIPRMIYDFILKEEMPSPWQT